MHMITQYLIILLTIVLAAPPPPPPAQPAQQPAQPQQPDQEGGEDEQGGGEGHVLTNKEKEERAGTCTEFAKIELSEEDQQYAGIDARDTELVKKASKLGIYPTNIVTWFMNADAADFFKRAPTYILNIISKVVQQTQPTQKARSREHILFKGNAVDAFRQIANAGKKVDDGEDEEGEGEGEGEGEANEQAPQQGAGAPPAPPAA